MVLYPGYLCYTAFMITYIEAIKFCRWYVVDRNSILDRESFDLIYVLALCFVIKVDLIKLLAVINCINDVLPANNQRTFFGALLLSEIFHGVKLRGKREKEMKERDCFNQTSVYWANGKKWEEYTS